MFVSFMIFFTLPDMFTYRYSGTAEGSGTAKTSLTFHLQGFPHPYSSKSCTYFIQGMLATDHIRIIFDDFDLDPDTSLLKVSEGRLSLFLSAEIM